MDAVAAEAVLDLISQNIGRYQVRSQAWLARASKSIQTGMIEAADRLSGRA